MSDRQGAAGRSWALGSHINFSIQLVKLFGQAGEWQPGHPIRLGYQLTDGLGFTW